MRDRLNRDQNTKHKNKDDEGRQNTAQEINNITKTTMASTKTELVIQIIFAAAMVAACFLSFLMHGAIVPIWVGSLMIVDEFRYR